MDKLLKWIERVVQVVSIISGIWATVEMVKTYMHKKHLKQKANDYLNDELELEGNIRGPVAVYSPTLKKQEKKVATLLVVTGISCMVSMILHIINKNRY